MCLFNLISVHHELICGFSVKVNEIQAIMYGAEFKIYRNTTPITPLLVNIQRSIPQALASGHVGKHSLLSLRLYNLHPLNACCYRFADAKE